MFISAYSDVSVYIYILTNMKFLTFFFLFSVRDFIKCEEKGWLMYSHADFVFITVIFSSYLHGNV